MKVKRLDTVVAFSVAALLSGCQGRAATRSGQPRARLPETTPHAERRPAAPPPVRRPRVKRRSSPARPAPAARRAVSPRRPNTLSLVAAGDVFFGRQIDRKLQLFGYRRPFRRVGSLIRGNDLALCNLETPITSRRLRWMPGVLVFRARPVAAKLLRRAGFNLVITANNHAFDQGRPGVRETLTHLKRAGLPWVGTGRTRLRAWKPYVTKHNGIRVGIIAATTIRNYNFRMVGAHVAYVHPYKAQRLRWVVRQLKRKVDVVVVSLHYGKEYATNTLYAERRLIRTLARAGCDLFLGHHPHVLRGIQRVGRMVAFFSLGNFMFDQSNPTTRESGLARVVFQKKNGRARIASAELVPVRIDATDGTPRRVKGRQAGDILRKVVSYSSRWKGKRYLRVVGDRLRVDLGTR